MAAKKGGLGKGLDALFTENGSDGGEMELRLSEIEPNRTQPRKEFDEAALQDLADSIQKHGVIQPILVRPLPAGGYQIVAGERRWRAARIAGLEKVPAVVRDMSDAETMEIALIENLQREDLNPIEEAEGYRVLMEEFGMTQDEVAGRLGKSRPFIANAVRLLGLPEELQNEVRSGRLSAGHGRTLLAFSSPAEQKKAAALALEGATVRQLERMAKTGKAIPPKPKSKPRDVYFDEVELSLSESLGSKVRVIEGSRKHLLEIEFYSREELTRLANRLAGEENG